jgi:hypothetical protein
MMMKISDIKDKELKEKILKAHESYQEAIEEAKIYALDKLESDLKNNKITKKEYIKTKEKLGF